MTSLRRMTAVDLLKTSLTNLDPLTENYDINFYLEYMRKWPSLFIKAEDSRGKIIGYIMGKVEEDPETLQYSKNYMPWHGHVTALTVAPQYRRQGIATKLMKAFEQACENEDAWFIDLFIRAGNVTAAKLYKGMGYSVYRRVVEYYSDDPTGRNPGGEDAFDMRKPLKKDVDGRHVRENGEDFSIQPSDLYHA